MFAFHGSESPKPEVASSPEPLDLIPVMSEAVLCITTRSGCKRPGTRAESRPEHGRVT